LFFILLLACISREESSVVATPVCSDDYLVSQVAKNITEEQRNTASIIEENFDKLSIPKDITAAAIVNAVAESGLKPSIIGDGGNSVGLFQLNKGGLGRKLSIEQRQDPTINSMVVGIQVLKNDNLLKREEGGATIPELTNIFTKEIMRPDEANKKGIARAALAKKIFPLEIPECL
jgi:hypothetical protein